MNTVTHCLRCGKEVLPGDGFCNSCGSSQQQPSKKTGFDIVRKGRLNRKTITLGAVVIILIMVMLMVFRFTLFLKCLAIGGMVMFVLSIVIMLLTFRKAKKISPVSLMISMIISVLSLGIYSLFIRVHLSGTIKIWALVSGILIGAGWALSTPLSLKDGIIKREGNVWYLAVWGLIFAVNQLTIAITGRPPQIAMALLLSGTGIVLGNSGSFIAMFYRLKAEIKRS